jgi:hypothetical protein
MQISAMMPGPWKGHVDIVPVGSGCGSFHPNALAICPRTTLRTGRVTTSGMTHVMGGS